MKETLAFIEMHLRTPMPTPALAARVELSASQLTRLFRQDTGLTPTAYVHRLRMERARILIERTSLSVSEVMEEVGVLDPSHFARDFRRAHGFSPRTLRRQLKMTTRAGLRIQWEPGG